MKLTADALAHNQDRERCVQSISLGGSSRRSSAQPICDVAYNPEEIKARLSGVPVYTVANKQNEFILVAGEVRNLASINQSQTGRQSISYKACMYVDAEYACPCGSLWPKR